jgi:phage shock protein PspC (stress-responsive transcriptional regulator)
MDKTIMVGLSGHPDQYRLEEAAYDRLTGYLDRAASRLQDDPDRAEVLRDLEGSIGDKLAALVGSGDRLVTATDIDRILDEIGAVDTGRDPGPEEADTKPRPRRLRRIREGQQLAGVCNGLADYAELRIDWVRTLFLLGTVVTGGILGLVYIALAFILPVSATRET